VGKTKSHIIFLFTKEGIYYTKNISFYIREECFKFDSIKHHRFSSGTPVSSCSNTGSIRDDPYWTSRKNSLELIELSSINKVNLV
jgi:hypothetical protein